MNKMDVIHKLNIQDSNLLYTVQYWGEEYNLYMYLKKLEI